MSDRRGGVLYVVATPIGNLEDASERAIRVLREADWIAAEDTRHTRKLLSRFGIRAARVFSCFGANESRRAVQLAARLRQGETGALVTDAGTPGIADPGAKIVRAALAADARVVAVPGPSALTAALSASGFPADRFTFLGFLSPSGSEREKALDFIETTEHTAVLYDSPRRIGRTMKELAGRVPKRGCVVFREITKLHEEDLRGMVSEVASRLSESGGRGEFVIVLGPSRRGRKRLDEDLLRDAMAKRLGKGMSIAEAARDVALRLQVSRREAYRAGIEVRRKGEPGGA